MATEELVEDVADVVEDVKNIVSVDVLPKKILVPVVLISALGGAVAGYFLAKKKLAPEYAALAEKEIEEARHYFAARHKTGEYSSPTELAKQYENEKDLETVREITQSYRSDDIEVAREAVSETQGETKEIAVLPTAVVNVFTQAEPPDTWNQEYEEAHRSEEEPYVINYDEWSANETEYEQSSLTYYNGDDVLTDSQDKPIPNTDEVVGDDNLLKFGYGSKDNNVVYIRNDRMELEFEVVQFNGKFVEHVLGFKGDLEHSERDRRPRRFRSYDE